MVGWLPKRLLAFAATEGEEGDCRARAATDWIPDAKDAHDKTTACLEEARMIEAFIKLWSAFWLAIAELRFAVKALRPLEELQANKTIAEELCA